MQGELSARTCRELVGNALYLGLETQAASGGGDGNPLARSGAFSQLTDQRKLFHLPTDLRKMHN